MNDATISSLHVSQNIPQKSPMEVTMENAADNQVHLSQSVPMSSPLTWKLTGDIGEERLKRFLKTSHFVQSPIRSR